MDRDHAGDLLGYGALHVNEEKEMKEEIKEKAINHWIETLNVSK